MIVPESFNVLAGQFCADLELVFDSLKSAAYSAAAILTKEQRCDVKAFLDQLIEANDVELAQSIWWNSKADISFKDDQLMWLLRHLSDALS